MERREGHNREKGTDKQGNRQTGKATKKTKSVDSIAKTKQLEKNRDAHESPLSSLCW